MMLLQYAVLGVWMPILPSYLRTDVASGGLGFDGYQVGWIIAIAPAIGAMTAPFLAGQLADRYFSSERYLAVALLIGGVIQWVLSQQTGFAAWAVLSVVYAISYFPTLGLTNSLAMAHLPDARRQFARVRLWGTVGWIAVAWIFPVIFLQQNVELRLLPPFVGGEDRWDATARIADALRVSAVISCAYAAYCLTLPRTPPHRLAAQSFALVTAFRLLRHRSVLVLLGTSLIIAAIDRIYFLQTAPYLQYIGLRTSQVMPAMAVGQLAEVPMMALLGTMLVRFGFRLVLSLGALCYFLRYAIFGSTGLPLEMIVGSQILHGVCFACSFTAAAIYIDRLVGPDARHSAQTGFTLVAAGPGSILGGLLNGWLEAQFTVGGALDYRAFWYVCAALGLAATLCLFWLFRDECRSTAAGSDIMPP